MSGIVSEATTTLSSSLSTNNLSMILLLLGIVALGVYVFFELRKMNRRIDEVFTLTTSNTTTTTMDQVMVDPMHNQSFPTQPMPQPMPQPAQASGVRPSTPYPTSEVRQASRAAPENAISAIDALMTTMENVKAIGEHPSVMDTKPTSVDVFPIETETDGLLNVPFPDITGLTRDISEDPFQSSVLGEGLQEQPGNEDHSKKSVSELKEILLKWGLATSGNKKKLIQRINEHTGVKADAVKTDVVKQDTSGPTTTDVLSSLDVTVNPSEPVVVASDVVAEGRTGENLSLP